MDKKRGFVKTFSSGMRMDFKKLDTLEDEVVFRKQTGRVCFLLYAIITVSLWHARF